MRARRLPRRRVVADPEPHAARARSRWRLDDRANRRDEPVFVQETAAGVASNRSERSSAAGSGAPKMLEPMTMTSAPASTTTAMFSRPTPPSTSSSQVGFRASISARASRSFAQRDRQEALAAEAGIDAHDQDHVSVLDDVFEHRDRRRRVQRDAGPCAERADVRQQALRVEGRLEVKGDDVGAGLAEVFDVAFRLDDHQVGVERARRQLAQVADDLGSPGDVGDEAAVHDVEVQVIGARPRRRVRSARRSG